MFISLRELRSTNESLANDFVACSWPNDTGLLSVFRIVMGSKIYGTSETVQTGVDSGRV